MNSTHTRLVLLGTGTPNANPARSGSALAIIANNTPYLVDFGPGVVRRAVAASQAGVDGLEVDKLNIAFLTHLHSDHTAGYPDLILTPWVLGRDVPLRVFGPTGIKAMTEHILAAYQQDIEQRIKGLEPANESGCQVVAQEIEAGAVYEDANVRVEAFPVKHGSWPAYGYRFTTEDRTIVVSGDTAPTENLVDEYRGCDILVHEVYSLAGFQTRPAVWQTYHSSVHTSTRELARIANAARPKLLVLYHQFCWGTSEEDLIAEVQQEYDGDVVSGNDLDVF